MVVLIAGQTLQAKMSVPNPQSVVIPVLPLQIVKELKTVVPNVYPNQAAAGTSANHPHHLHVMLFVATAKIVLVTKMAVSSV